MLPDSYLPKVELYCLRNETGVICAFMGIGGSKLEMLFVRSGYMGKGFGGRLLEYAVDAASVDSVDVNEQNPTARAFYEKHGFTVVSRDEKDHSGNPFPILHMKLRR